ncbi:hypothetical protein MANES_02G196400v8 [Manihot esculenta]|uniref:Uncharacterized protein n=2 Tax=Manihot esculenta TaxID=3983 RepID=A0ACB7I7F0_MANES|nr:hypothetical protein MANES_02G196400v8 [Manihot esculenta]KAG8660802.1 hypothetical protein MANES_02G196400v8 [Manihot esculenta]
MEKISLFFYLSPFPILVCNKLSLLEKTFLENNSFFTFFCSVEVIVTMDSMRGQGGIQMLLNAEQEAQQIVAAARNLKLTRLKQAKDEAEKDVAAYKSKLESEHQKKLSETSGSSGTTVKRLEEETQVKIKQLKESASKVQPEIIATINKYITTVHK